jgi:hypothetical protein
VFCDEPYTSVSPARANALCAAFASDGVAPIPGRARSGCCQVHAANRSLRPNQRMGDASGKVNCASVARHLTQLIEKICRTQTALRRLLTVGR